MKKICLNCSAEFETHSHDKKFCSTLCRAALWLKRKNILHLHKRSSAPRIPQFQVEKGELFNWISKTKRTEDFWIFCHAMFWNTQDFTEEEQCTFKHLISDYFKCSADPDVTFLELVERACLAKKRIEENPSLYVEQPEDWLNHGSTSGLASTEKSYKELQQQRKRSPGYHCGLTAFAEAVLSYARTRNVLDITRYRHVFVSLTHYDLLQWYMNIVMHYQFIDFDLVSSTHGNRQSRRG